MRSFLLFNFKWDKTIWLVWFILINATLVYAQTNNELIDKTNIEKIQLDDQFIESYTSDSDFDYTEKNKDENWLNNLLFWLKSLLSRFWESLFGSSTVDGFLFFVFRVLPYLVLGVLAFLLLKLLVNSNISKNTLQTRSGNQVYLSEEEKLINSSNLQSLIEQAIQKDNFRLAIRYYYLKTLKLLTERKHIDWQFQKTNHDYLSELKKSKFHSVFGQITHIYDYAWYGEFPISKQKFQLLKPKFEKFIDQLK